MGKEIWKDIEGYEGLYRVSNKGRVKSLYTWNGAKYIHREEPFLLTPSNSWAGYKVVNLVKDKKMRTKRVHRLVGKAFIENTENKPQINHKDGNKANNHVNNLEWSTQKENVIHGYKTGLTPKISEKTKSDIVEDYYNKVPNIDITKKYNISNTYIYDVLKERGLKPEGVSVRKDKYGIDREELKMDFAKDKRNKDLAVKYNCPSSLIARLKYMYKEEINEIKKEIEHGN